MSQRVSKKNNYESISEPRFALITLRISGAEKRRAEIAQAISVTLFGVRCMRFVRRHPFLYPATPRSIVQTEPRVNVVLWPSAY